MQKWRGRNPSKGNRNPLSSEELIEILDSTGPFQHIYNAITWSVDPERTLHEHGHVKTIENQATKLWGISSDWESLITKKRSAKAGPLRLLCID